MYTGTSIALAMLETSPGFNRLKLSLPSVKTITARLRPTRVLARSAACAIASCRDVAPNGFTRLKTRRKRSEVRGEGGDLIKPRVEGEDRPFVPAGLEPAQKMARGFARLAHQTFHAAADVKQQGHADAGKIGTKIADGAPHAAVEDFEVPLRQVAHETALSVADNRRHAHEIDARREGGDGGLLSRRFNRPQRKRPKENGHRRHELAPLHHGHPYYKDAATK